MLKIQNAKVFDPANGMAGKVCDLWFEDGRILPGPRPGEPFETLDATGCVAMAGAVDIHSHIAGEPLQLLRDAGSPVIPPVWEAGRQYAAMGYTAVVNAAVPALAAPRTILEEQALGTQDCFNLTWVGENPAMFASAATPAGLDAYLCWLLGASCGWGLKLINPLNGGDGWQALTLKLMEANARLGLPHPLHLHHPFLAQPGAYAELRQTMELASGLPLHLAHLQFYSYKKNAKGTLVSAAAELAAELNAHPNISADVGAVVPGAAAAVSCDTAFVAKLATGKKGARTLLWEQDGGMAVLPLNYSAASQVGSTQFLAGLELLLCVERPEQILLTTDHPNGGPFSAYPYLIALLMDSAFRQEELKKLHPVALKSSAVPGIGREYTLDEVARLTRSGPAARLGAAALGHLGPGACGGVALYREQNDKQQMFKNAHAVLRGKTRIFCAPLPQQDMEPVRRLVQPYLDVEFTAGPSAGFKAANRIEKGVR